MTPSTWAPEGIAIWSPLSKGSIMSALTACPFFAVAVLKAVVRRTCSCAPAGTVEEGFARPANARTRVKTLLGNKQELRPGDIFDSKLDVAPRLQVTLGYIKASRGRSRHRLVRFDAITFPHRFVIQRAEFLMISEELR